MCNVQIVVGKIQEIEKHEITWISIKFLDTCVDYYWEEGGKKYLRYYLSFLCITVRMRDLP